MNLYMAGIDFLRAPIARREPQRFAGRRLLLIDDIRTTGATLSECVRVLKEAGAKDVLCLTLAAGERKK